MKRPRKPNWSAKLRKHCEKHDKPTFYGQCEECRKEYAAEHAPREDWAEDLSTAESVNKHLGEREGS